jgi:DNA-binding beta-propeller fold protein YncE
MRRVTSNAVDIGFGKEQRIYVLTRGGLGTEVRVINWDDENLGTRGEGAFTWPASLLVDEDELLYISDEAKHNVTVMDKDGEIQSTWGEEGSGDGQFNRPSSMSFDSDGNIIISDTMNHRIQHLTSEGEVINTWGGQGAGEGQFQSPWGVNLDGEGNVFVADHRNHRIQKFDAGGSFISSLGSHGSEAGKLDHPTDVAIDPDGDIYVCDWANHRVQVFDKAGEYLLQMGGSAIELSKWQKRFVEASPDMVKARRRVQTLDPETRFALPTCVRFDAGRNRLYVVDSQRWRIQIFDKLVDYAEPQFNI